MNGFRFPPPPPPPPPKPSTGPHETSQHNYTGQERGRGSSRGRNFNHNRDRGGRGGSHLQRQGRQHSANGLNNNNNNNTRTNHFNSLGPNNPSFSTPNVSSNFQNHSFNGIPPGSHVNPSFMTGFDQQTSLQSTNKSNVTASHIPRTVAGHKRKLEALRGPQQERKSHGPPTAPSVPSFGTGILTAQRGEAAVQSSKDARRPPSKHASKALGLTPRNGVPVYSASESDESDADVDEEAMYAELGTALTFEHNGTVLSLNSTADLTTWIRERRKNWPTQARMIAKLEERRAIGEIRKKLISDAIAFLSSSQSRKSLNEASRGDDKVRMSTIEKIEEQTLSDNNKLSFEVLPQEELCPAESASTANVFGTDENRDEGGDQLVSMAEKVDESSGTDNDTESVSPSSPLEQDSDSFPDDSEDSGPPDELHVKPKNLENHLRRPLCRYFSASGFCRDGDGCRFRHERSGPSGGKTPANSESKQQLARQHADKQKRDEPGHGSNGIYKLLTQREQDDEDLLALQAIKFLGEHGFFSQQEQYSEP